MRTLMAAFLLIIPACRDRDQHADAPVHPGEPTVRQRAGAVDTLPREVRFLNRMLEHQQRLRSLLDQARVHDLSDRTRRIVERADGQRLEHEADLTAALEKYRGGGSPPTKPAGAEPLALPGQLHEAEYEKALLRTLVANYRGEVKDIESFLPGLSADMTGLAKQIRSQRLHEIDKLTRE
ncbi:MAG: hypothetical protein ACREMZ_13635 [Gemmatimonadales bacterium]